MNEKEKQVKYKQKMQISITLSLFFLFLNCTADFLRPKLLKLEQMEKTVHVSNHVVIASAFTFFKNYVFASQKLSSCVFISNPRILVTEKEEATPLRRSSEMLVNLQVILMHILADNRLFVFITSDSYPFPPG